MSTVLFAAAAPRLVSAIQRSAVGWRRPLLRGALLIALLLLLAAPLAAQISIGPQLNAAPTNGTALGTISVSGDRLLIGGDYRVVLVVAANDRRTLATVLDGDGEFTRNVTIPSIAPASYSLELTVNNVLRDSANFRVLAPLAITLTPVSPRAGTIVSFSVSGLTNGSLSLVYAGRTSFGPVSVTNSTYNGRMRIPTDRPSSLPANVVLSANNGVGRLISRRGSRTVSVQPANLNPFARVLSSAPSITSPTPRQTLRVTGSVGTNEATATDVTVQHFWTGSDGRTQPMGAAQAAVSAGGTFDHGMRTPQIGTMSAAQALGPGQMTTVTRFRDSNGVAQHTSTTGSTLSSRLDTDAAIDLTLNLRGSNGVNIEGARVDLVNVDIDELYPPNSNEGAVSLQGAISGAMATQFDPPPISQEALGCPANIERQYTNALGRAEFQFDLAVPNGGTDVDGSGPPAQATIMPTDVCVPSSPGNPGFCTVIDPAGVHFRAVVRARHTGYGYEEGSATDRRERPVTLDVRIDRYTGQMKITTCRPGVPCVETTYQTSANIFLTLPSLGNSGLTLGDPYFVNAGGVEGAFEVADSTSGIVKFKPITDLTPFEGSRATFEPAEPPARVVEFRYNAGAGRPLANARFFMRSGSGPLSSVLMSRVAGSTDCSGEGGSEVWRATLPASLNAGFRFPGRVQGRLGKIPGLITATDTSPVPKTGAIQFEFNFIPLSTEVNALINLPVTPDQPSLHVNTFNPHARRLEVTPPIRDGVATSEAAPPEYNVSSKRSKVAGAAGYEFCMPKSATTCGAVTAVAFEHEQFNKEPGSQPADASASGNAAGVIKANAGTEQNPWVELFDATIPLFRWYWGIPELLSAEVFADLVIRAEYLLKANFNPVNPLAASVDAGGRLGIGILIGVDIDVLFGVLIDAGASIYGAVIAEVVTETTLDSVAVNPCLTFRMDFTGWLEIGCPIPNPLDPTCYIPNIEETFNILQDRNPTGCGFRQYGIAAANPSIFDPSPALVWPGAVASSQSATVPSGGPPPPLVPFPREQRRAMHRTPALAFDGTGNRLVLNLSREGHLVAREGLLRALGAPQTLSTGWGIRDVAVSYFSTDRAVAVWSESSMPSVPAGSLPPRPTRNSAAAAQRLRYALFDGDRWLPAVNLTAAGFGEGQVKLARCKVPIIILRGGCVEKVSLAFQRNTGRTVGGEKHIFFAQFNGTRWTAPVQVDQTGTINITPSITYAGGEPVVAWVRYAPATGINPPVKLDDVSARFLAMRVMNNRDNEQIALGGSTRFIAQPSIAGKTNGQIAIAYTTGGTTNYIGTRQALRLGQRSCPVTDTCAFTTWPVRDHHGRPLYVERPTLNLNNSGDAIVTYRGLAVGPVPGNPDPEDNIFPDDPIGIRMSRGELLQVRSPLQPSTVRPLSLSANAAIHFQPGAAYDPVNDEVVGISVTIATAQTRAAAAEAATTGARAVAQIAVVEDGIDLAMVADLPDLFVEKLTTTSTNLTPGALIPVTIEIANRGSAWTVDADHTATVRFWWDTPQTRTVTSASFTLGSIAAGAKLVRVVQVPVPAAFGVDERQTLRAAVEVESEDGEIDGDNNESTLSLGGMPVPLSLMAVSTAGTRFVNLVWAAPADARIAGYRIYVDDPNGVPQPLGSSFNKGWADLTALYGRQRTYRVSTYSARGVESELSSPVIAEPSPAALTEELFSNGFE